MQDLAVSPIEDVERALQQHRYVADRSLATTIFLAVTVDKPLLLEGEAGVGKTEVGKVLAEILDARLIRLQCYEGIDVNNAGYDWAYATQMLHIRLLESAGANREETEREIYSPQFLVKRPLLQAIESDGGTAPVLLIDEIDRADDEFEAFLLELLSDFQISIPEIGTIKADKPPAVIITSNRTRQVHGALTRRCLYFWIDYPSIDREYEIITARVPDVPKKLARQVSAFIGGVRHLDLYKLPGIAETLDWTRSLIALGEVELNEAAVQATLGSIVKYQEDLERLRGAGSRQTAVRERGTAITVTGRQLKVLDEGEGAEGAEELEVASYSQVELLRQKDFDTLTEAEMAEVRRLIRLMRLPAGLTRSRRARAGGRDRLDIRRLLRRSLRFGGELLVFSWKSPTVRPRPLVLLCDISGSMERYTRLLLNFAYALKNASTRVETFVFATRLTRITRLLRSHDIDAALNRVTASVDDWSGGTRIGEAIETFNRRYARRVLSRGATVALISDGWDRGDAAQMRQAIARLQRSCHRLIWMNPLMGAPGYEPLTLGLQAALPFVDDFLPAHNLANLEALGALLLETANRRPVRRQTPVVATA